MCVKPACSRQLTSALLAAASSSTTRRPSSSLREFAFDVLYTNATIPEHITSALRRGAIDDPFLISMIFTIVNVCSTPISFYTIEKFGRRPLLVYGAFGMLICQFVVAIVGVTVGFNKVGPSRCCLWACGDPTDLAVSHIPHSSLLPMRTVSRLPRTSEPSTLRSPLSLSSSSSCKFLPLHDG